MPFLLRVELPDVPGSLGRVATAIGEAGGDIEAIEIVEHRGDGTAVDDVLLDTVPGTMPDSIVSACNALDGVQVLWISRYAGGGGLVLDLEAVEDLTARPDEALERLVDLLPPVFRSDWAARLRRTTSASDGEESTVVEVLSASEAAPPVTTWPDVSKAVRVDVDEVNVVLAAPLGTDEVVLVGRRGGPEYLDSEVARFGHLVELARTIARA